MNYSAHFKTLVNTVGDLEDLPVRHRQKRGLGESVNRAEDMVTVFTLIAAGICMILMMFTPPEIYTCVMTAIGMCLCVAKGLLCWIRNRTAFTWFLSGIACALVMCVLVII